MMMIFVSLRVLDGERITRKDCIYRLSESLRKEFQPMDVSKQKAFELKVTEEKKALNAAVQHESKMRTLVADKSSSSSFSLWLVELEANMDDSKNKTKGVKIAPSKIVIIFYFLLLLLFFFS